MSRLDFIDNNTHDDVNHNPNAKLYNQSNCNYCFDTHTENMVGCISLKMGLWFCGPSCQHMYVYDNKLAQFTPELKLELEIMRKKFYSSDKFLKRQRMAQR